MDTENSQLFDEAEDGQTEEQKALMQSLVGDPRIARVRDRMVGIQTGAEEPPSWFERTGFDTGTITVELEDGVEIDIEVIAATSTAMEALDRSTTKTELMNEQNAVIEAIKKLPEEIHIRRPFKINNKPVEIGTHYENLWDLYMNKPKDARIILGQLLNGKLYEMVKMGMMWLSKVTLGDLVDLDPEEGSETAKRPPVST